MRSTATAEKALQLAEEITQLRAALRDREEKFFALFGSPVASSAAVSVDTNGLIQTNVDTGSAAERLRAFFRERPGKATVVAEIRQALPDIEPKLIRSTVHRLASTKGMPGLRSIGRGRYKYRPEQPEADPNGSMLATPGGLVAIGRRTQ